MIGNVFGNLSGLIEGNPIIVYGGVKQYPQRAKKTEEFLVGKCFSDRKVIIEMNFVVKILCSIYFDLVGVVERMCLESTCLEILLSQKICLHCGDRYM